ncbi:MAG: response regulator transcription factor [Eubacteriales bacterium]|mgnify:CR=1 FL=1|nr:response regulator transcription factor [Clostridiales bacterium]
MKLLIAEDERELSAALCAILRHNNYSVDAVYDGQDALDYAASGDYDGVILDIMLPRRDGVSVLTELRKRGIDVPVLLLTAKSDVADRITGLDAGADDYLTKPFDTGELLARIRAMMRRRSQYVPGELKYGNIRLNRETLELSVEGGSSCRLGNREFQMLELMMSNPQRIVSTEQFMSHVWGYDSEAEIGVVWVYISHLRKKLAALGANVEIKAQRGVGYCLEIKPEQA